MHKLNTSSFTIYTGLLLLLCFEAISQPIPRSSPQPVKAGSVETEDSNQVLQYIYLIDSFTAKNEFTASLNLIHKAQALSKKLNYGEGVFFSILKMGQVYEEIRKDYPRAIECYQQAIDIAEAHQSIRNLHQAYSCILNMYYYIGDYPKAMAIAQKGVLLSEKMDDKEALANYCGQLGFIYLKQEKVEEAIGYYKQYLELARQLNRQRILAHAYTCLGEVYLLEKNVLLSLQYLFGGLSIYKKEDSLQIQQKQDDSEIAGKISHTLFQLSEAYKLQGNYSRAMSYALDGMHYHYGFKAPSYNKYDLASYYVNAGEIYMALKENAHAVGFLQKALSLSRSIHHREDIRAAYNGLSQMYAAENKYDSAYHYQLLYSALKDSLINESASRAIEQVRSSFEADKKDKEIAFLKQEQKLKEIAARNRNLLFIAMSGCFMLLILVAIPFLYIRNKHKKQKADYEKRLAIQAERQRISSDMHDDIGTGLSTMLIYIDMLKSKMNGSTEYPAIERIALLGNELVSHMKEIVWSFNPGNDSLESLLVFIRQYFTQLFSSLPYQTSLVFPDSIPFIALNGIIRRNVFLCVKEALGNVIKHAVAQWVELNIGLNANVLTITVQDDGIGFPTRFDENTFNNGLKNMQLRMGQINGSFSFYNRVGAVVVISLQLPQVPQGVLVE